MIMLMNIFDRIMTLFLLVLNITANSAVVYIYIKENERKESIRVL